MTEFTQTLEQMKAADRMVRRVYRDNGPRSFKRGIGGLLNALVENDGATQRELVDVLCWDRGMLKDAVRKAQRRGYVTIENVDAPRTYRVHMTEEGRMVAEKRIAAQDALSARILDCLDAEEQAQLNRLTAKIIASLEDAEFNQEKAIA